MVDERKTIKVSPKMLKSLNLLKAMGGFSSMEKLIEAMKKAYLASEEEKEEELPQVA